MTKVEERSDEIPLRRGQKAKGKSRKSKDKSESKYSKFFFIPQTSQLFCEDVELWYQMMKWGEYLKNSYPI